MHPYLKKILRKKLPGFSLIELSIVMIIVGIIMAGVFKGQDLIEAARLQSTVSEMNRIKMLILQYHDQFGYWPGNDHQASQRFGNGVQSGNGNGLIQDRESAEVWRHLHAAGLLEMDCSPSPKIGGQLTVKGNPDPNLSGNWIILSEQSGTLRPILTPKQAMTLKAKMDESDPQKGNLRVINGHGTNGNACINGSAYNLQNTNQACCVMIRIS